MVVGIWGIKGDIMEKIIVAKYGVGEWRWGLVKFLDRRSLHFFFFLFPCVCVEEQGGLSVFGLRTDWVGVQFFP